MSDEPMLVSERWLTNADRSLRDLRAPKTSKRKQGLFYLVRPFRLQTNWTKNDDGEWTATACPTVDYKTGRVDLNATVEIFAPIHEIKPDGTALTHRFFGVLRGGRWEYVGRDDLFRSYLKKTLVPTELEVDATAQALTSVRATIALETSTNISGASAIREITGFYNNARPQVYVASATFKQTGAGWTSGNILKGITGLENDSVSFVPGNRVASVAELASTTIYEWVEEENA